MLVGMQIGTATMGNTIEVFQTIKNRTTIGPNNPTLGYILKGNEISLLKRYLYSLYLTALFTKAKT